MEVGGKNLAQQHVIPYFEGHELAIVHDVVEWITGSIICRKLWYNELSWGFVVNDVRTERRGEHVIQSLADGAWRGCV